MTLRCGCTPQAERLLDELKSKLTKHSQFRSKRDKRIRGNTPEIVSEKEILALLAEFGLRQFRTQCSSHIHKCLTSSAWRCLYQALLERLSAPLMPTIRIVRQAVEAAAMSVPKHRRIERAEGFDAPAILLDLFEHFSGTAEMAAQLILDWSDAQLEMLHRLARDRKHLRAIIPEHPPETSIAFLNLGLSDAHDGARSVALIGFENGDRLIYKPRSSEGERVWFGALRWMNRHGFHVDFKIPKILSRNRFFWMESLQPQNCKTAGCVKRFYFQWGAQAALAEILQLEDLHRDNWIASGEHPILIDAEIISQPSRNSSGHSASWARLDPLLRTGLLPIDNREKVGFYSGIAPFDVVTAPSEKLHFWPRLNGHSVPPVEFSEDVVEGYQAAIEFVTASERRPFGRVAAMRGKAKHRILYRATTQYYDLLRHSYLPKYMVERGARLKQLKQACTNAHVPRGVAIQEVNALFRSSIPRFVASAAGRLKRAVTDYTKMRDSSRLLRTRLRPAAKSIRRLQASAPHRQA